MTPFRRRLIPTSYIIPWTSLWMIENENLTDAVRVVTALARFFRISLSGERAS